MAELRARGRASTRFCAFVARHIPTRASVERSRVLRPLAHRVLAPSLWRFTRRSVPRGVALGIAVAVLVPVARMPAAALLALTVRANVPVAAGTTLLHNPFTVVPLYLCAYRLGAWLTGPGTSARGAGWAQWLVAQGGPATVTGLLVIAAVGASTGFAAASLLWRWRTSRKWRARGI